MIELIPIKYSTELNLDSRQIYEEAFPPDERRDWLQLTDLLHNEQFVLNEIYFEKQMVGLISFWNLDDFIFIEHFTIRDSERSKGFGTQGIKQLLQEKSLPVILEVEKPISEAARRRIRFYEHLNFKTCSGDYFQPPYSVGKNAVEMLLMSYPEEIGPADFSLVRSKIHHTVYRFFK